MFKKIFLGILVFALSFGIPYYSLFAGTFTPTTYSDRTDLVTATYTGGNVRVCAWRYHEGAWNIVISAPDQTGERTLSDTGGGVSFVNQENVDTFSDTHEDFIVIFLNDSVSCGSDIEEVRASEFYDNEIYVTYVAPEEDPPILGCMNPDAENFNPDAVELSTVKTCPLVSNG